ncbi:MAG TPA: PEP-CTERM sorting domain-containing protein [Bacteroidota bacterium]|nr:PEP-CTERM sorting domain-containing protein [Bacteroidota bacterium]
MKQSILPLVALGLSLALLVTNIVVESEPGAVPLLCVAASAAWLILARRRKRG